MLNLTHSEGVARAEKWLLGRGGCSFALSEFSTAAMEIPDSIGFSAYDGSTLVEFKCSRSDFLADKKKYFRRKPETGMGQRRYFMCPKGLISPEELPEAWGLLYVLPKTVKVVVKAVYQTADLETERRFLVSALRRVHLRGDLGKIYDYGTLSEVVGG